MFAQAREASGYCRRARWRGRVTSPRATVAAPMAAPRAAQPAQPGGALSRRQAPQRGAAAAQRGPSRRWQVSGDALSLSAVDEGDRRMPEERKVRESELGEN